MSRQSYWREAVESSLSDHGITASKEQIEAIAGDMDAWHESYGQSSYQPENPMIDENHRLKAELLRERDKISCATCGDRGRTETSGGTYVSNSPCWKCNGAGKVDGSPYTNYHEKARK